MATLHDRIPDVATDQVVIIQRQQRQMDWQATRIAALIAVLSKYADPKQHDDGSMAHTAIAAATTHWDVPVRTPTQDSSIPPKRPCGCGEKKP